MSSFGHLVCSVFSVFCLHVLPSFLRVVSVKNVYCKIQGLHKFRQSYSYSRKTLFFNFNFESKFANTKKQTGFYVCFSKVCYFAYSCRRSIITLGWIVLVVTLTLGSFAFLFWFFSVYLYLSPLAVGWKCDQTWLGFCIPNVLFFWITCIQAVSL